MTRTDIPDDGIGPFSGSRTINTGIAEMLKAFQQMLSEDKKDSASIDWRCPAPLPRYAGIR